MNGSKPLAQIQAELATSIVEALGFELTHDARLLLRRGVAGGRSFAVRPGVRSGRRKLDQPAFVSESQVDHVKELIAHYTIELSGVLP